MLDTGPPIVKPTSGWRTAPNLADYEADAAQLASLDGCVAYLEVKLGRETGKTKGAI